jgi:hypothetical protein
LEQVSGESFTHLGIFSMYADLTTSTRLLHTHSLDSSLSLLACSIQTLVRLLKLYDGILHVHSIS